MSDIRDTFYDAKWQEWNDMIYFSPAPRLRRKKILSWLKEIPVRTALDVGCGNGEFLECVRRVRPDIRLAGGDISTTVIEKNRSRMPSVDFHVLDLNTEMLPLQFEAVICMEVIEHCVDYRAAIGKLARMTEKWLFITVPCGPLFEIDRRVGHTKHFTAAEIASALSASAMKVIKLQCWGFPFFNLYKHAINLFPDRMCDAFLSDRRYGAREKFVAWLTYAAFRTSLPFWGYQMFIMARH